MVSVPTTCSARGVLRRQDQYALLMLEGGRIPGGVRPAIRSRNATSCGYRRGEISHDDPKTPTTRRPDDDAEGSTTRWSRSTRERLSQACSKQLGPMATIRHNE